MLCSWKRSFKKGDRYQIDTLHMLRDVIASVIATNQFRSALITGRHASHAASTQVASTWPRAVSGELFDNYIHVSPRMALNTSFDSSYCYAAVQTLFGKKYMKI